ncbi:MAG TPA: hypothetical protein VFG42_00875 [Baekduia sp.]|uniref:hypothetical protein n=1 Tax=Baekduia sp. TaxID=2600305 RepID=UPI002D76732A|nr:hypothetical protein [Baekduia sp.]HET6505313.1 hypothetical protein [Baekduia sp.]
MSDEVLVLDEATVREVASGVDALGAAREAFVALSRGAVEQPDVLSLDLRRQRGEVHAKGAFIHGAPFYTIKVASGFYGNPALGLPVAGGAVWVFDAATGALRAILLDRGHLTDVRTGAAGAVAADLLARPDSERAVVVGAGGQARHQMAALARVRELRHITVWARDPEAGRRCAEDVAAATGVETTTCADLRDAVHDADVVVTATPAREPLVRAGWIQPGTHVTAIGSDLPGKVELEPALLAGSRVFADRLAQCRTQGEIAAAIAAGAIAEGDVVAELGDVAAGAVTGRAASHEVTIADLTGVGALDAALAVAVVERALAAGAGMTLRA